jgi:hypothetical protein
MYPVVAETRAEAEDHAAFIDTLPKEIDGLSLLSEVLNFDFSKQPIDEPLTQEAIDSWTGMQGMRDRMRCELGGRLPTPRDFINITRRGTMHDHPRFVGSPKDVADGMEEWFSTRARRIRGRRLARPGRLRRFFVPCRPRTAGQRPVPHGLRRNYLAREPWPRTAPGRGVAQCADILTEGRQVITAAGLSPVASHGWPVST